MTTTLHRDTALTRAPNNSYLDARKVAIIATVGFVLWFVGIFEIRWAGAAGVLSNGFTPVVYAFIVVATIPFIWITPRVLGLPRAYRMHCGTIMGATAALLDGMAVRWTHWYASDPQLLANSAATLLWAIGVAVALGFAMSMPSRRS
jgi:Co/Zn/Cd efflux system component